MLIPEDAGLRARQLWVQLHRYAGAFRWLTGKLWQAFRWRLIRAVVAAQVGVLVISGGLALFVHYAQALETGGLFEVPPLDAVSLPARDESTLLLMVGVLLGVLLAGGAILLWAQRTIISMAVELNHHVRMDVALAYGGQLPESTDWHNDKAMWRALWVLQTRDARRTAIVSRNLLRNSVNVGIGIVGLAALLYLEAQVTAVFLGVMAVALVAYYYANRLSVQATRRYEAVAPGTRKGLHRLLPTFQTLSQPRPAREELEAALDQEAVAEETHAFRERFGGHVYSEFLSFVVMGVVLAGLIGYMGQQALAGEIGWTRLIAYMVVLRITLESVRAIFGTFAFFSRFYPSIDRLHQFFQASNSATSGRDLDELSLPGADEAVVERPELAGPVVRGEAVGVVLPVTLSRYSLGLMATALAGPGAARQRRLLGQIAMAAPLSAPPAAASMHSLLMLDGGWTAEGLREQLGDQAGPVERAIGLDPTAVVPAEAWAQLPDDAAARLVLVAAEASERPVLAVDHNLLTRTWAQRLIAGGRRDRVVLVCSRGPCGDGAALGVRRSVVAFPDGRIGAIGSPGWIARNWDALGTRRGDTTAPAMAGDDDLEEE